MRKKLLLILLMLLTMGNFAMASSRPAPGTKEEQLLEKVRGNIRNLDAYYGTGKNIDGQNLSRNFIKKVLNNKLYSSYVSLAFDDVMDERLESYNNALKYKRDQSHVNAMQMGIDNLKLIRREFGL